MGREKEKERGTEKNYASHKFSQNEQNKFKYACAEENENDRTYRDRIEKKTIIPMAKLVCIHMIVCGFCCYYYGERGHVRSDVIAFRNSFVLLPCGWSVDCKRLGLILNTYSRKTIENGF